MNNTRLAVLGVVLAFGAVGVVLYQRGNFSAQLVVPSFPPIIGGGSSSSRTGQVKGDSGGGTSTVSSMALCDNVISKQDITKQGSTLDGPTKSGGKVRGKYRCDKQAAQSSAKDDATKAFKNACVAPDDVCPDGCVELRLAYDYNFRGMKFTYNTTEVTAQECPGGKGYTSTATVTGVCTATRFCALRT